jgi:hypothetical protein
MFETTPTAASNESATGEEKRDETAGLDVKLGLEHSRLLGHTFEPLITSADAARLLGNIQVKTLQRYARRGDLLGYQIGRPLVFPRLRSGHLVAISGEFKNANPLTAWISHRR